MLRKIFITLLLFMCTTAYNGVAYAENTEPAYTQLRPVDNGTFNEYRYKITDEFFNLRNKYEIENKVNVSSAAKILDYATKGYNYLPDSLSNKNYFSHLKTSIERGIKYPNNSSNYTSIVWAIENFLDKTNIQTIKWNVEAFPKTGNAPLTVTLRANVADPTGTKIPSYNYTWWIYENGQRKILGDNISLKHLFKEEGKFSVFLDVKSAHKNEKGYNDVLPFSSRADITIKEKVASVIIKVNSMSLRNKDELKFTPDEARYGLLFDATSSTPTSWTQFIKTKWEFWNGEIREYSGDPRVERVVYAKEWEFTVKLTLKTNELKQIERKFTVNIHDPIATINSSLEEGFLWDKFTFSAQNNTNDKDLSYSWEIIDLNQDKVIFRKAWSLFTYTFSEKGKYNVKMKVTEPSWESDVDSKIIYINSRAPVADYVHSTPHKNKPNRVFLDATKSFDPDFSDDGKLKYTWIINGDRVELEEANFNGSTWYYTFDSVWDHSVVLEVEDPDNISSQKKTKVGVKSILSVDFYAFPRVAQRTQSIRFVSESPEAKFYEWDFWDGTKKWGVAEKFTHKYDKSGIFKVKLTVRDENDNINTHTKNVYIWESDAPYSFISLFDSTRNDVAFDEGACEDKWAYLVNRVDSVIFSWKESINITWENKWLTYSWKLGKQTYKNSSEFTKKFDELGCFPVKLTVKSDDNGKTHSRETYVKVENVKPVLSSLDVKVVDDTSDPVIVNISALWAKDKDGVIQSYLWYYYTDIDSEPQDFRATKWPSTSFVLPKVTWNYYFVVVMKDNNEERISSEEITGSKYFMTLSWDNLNTPLVRLLVDDSSISIWDEAVFTATVENILGQDLSKKVKYSWDFDSDWFYDTETDTNVISHTFHSSWEKHIKVKAKYKGFSNTKSITVNVSNVLKPDFWYISIWSKFVFFDNSLWKATSYDWDLWDGTFIKDTKSFIHTYTDNKVSHNVKLKIAEGTKVKDIEAKVVKNVKNTIYARKQGIVVFSNPTMNSDKQIVLKEQWENAFIYLGESKPDISNYVIDYDIEYDSDLNWSDDDEDNKESESYTSWEAIKVELNTNRYQKIRVFIKNTQGKVVDSKDIIIIKDYIEEETIDINSIVFNGVSESIKIKIEQLKTLVSNLPKQHKLKALMYVQKLQEEWNDNREKTNVILEFEWFIYDIWVNSWDEIINLLESLLVENQEDKSEKAITFNALKNLIPVWISCGEQSIWENESCYDSLVSKLEFIRDNDILEENKALWSQILEIIAVDAVMTNKEKLDFKAILKTFVYGWVENIPEEEINIPEEEEDNSGGFLSLLTSIIKWLFIIIAIFVGIVWVYYIYYLLVNKDKNIWFQDFIIEKTKWGNIDTEESSDDLGLDLLDDLEEENKKIEQQIEESEKTEEKVEEVKEEEKQEVEQKGDKEEVPSWLKWNFEEDLKEEKTEDTKQETKQEEVSTPEEKLEEANNVISENEKADVPDWLKWSFEEGTKKSESKKQKEKEQEPKKQQEKKQEVKQEQNNKKQEKKQEHISDKQIEEETKIDDENIPDWLKWSFTEPEKQDKKEENKEEKKETQQEEKTENKQEAKKQETKQEEVKQENKPKKSLKNKKNKQKLKTSKQETKQQEEENKEKKQDKKDELWDDWMTIPDWLKTEDEK